MTTPAVLELPAPLLQRLRPMSVRWHGRGGFGAKTAATLLAEMIIDAGAYGQAAPEFGPERRGAPVQAFTRIGPSPITRRGPIEEPDVLVVLDARLLMTASVTSGLRDSTVVFVNASGPVPFPEVPVSRIITLDASAIARSTIGKDIPNIPMLAAVVIVLDLMPHPQFLVWLHDRLAREFRPELVAANLLAAEAAIEQVLHER